MAGLSSLGRRTGGRSAVQELKVRMTLSWRGVDSNFQYAGAVRLVVAPLLTRPVAWAGPAAGRAPQPPPSEKPKGRSGVSPSRRHKPGKGSFGRRMGLFPSLFL